MFYLFVQTLCYAMFTYISLTGACNWMTTEVLVGSTVEVCTIFCQTNYGNQWQILHNYVTVSIFLSCYIGSLQIHHKTWAFGQMGKAKVQFSLKATHEPFSTNFPFIKIVLTWWRLGVLLRDSNGRDPRCDWQPCTGGWRLTWHVIFL